MNSPTLLCIIVLGMTASWVPGALAFSGGAAGNPPCNSCHTGAPGPSVNFVLNNAAVKKLSVPQGSTVSLSLRVASTAQKNTGFNVASSSGAVVLELAGDPGTKIVAPGQVTHTSRRPTDAKGIADFPFKITGARDAACGTISTLTGEGLASSGPTTTGGMATTVTIAVKVTCP